MAWLKRLLDQRREYCQFHGYGLYARYVQDFAAENKPVWEALGLAPLRLLRQALQAFPSAEWFWLLGPSIGIQDMVFSLNEHLDTLSKAQYPAKSNSDKTRRSTGGSRQNRGNGENQGGGRSSPIAAPGPAIVSCILTYNPHHKLLSSDSIMIRRSLVAQSLLELIADPVIQEHEPFRATGDHAGAALTHLVRYHPLLARSIALVKPEWLGVAACDADAKQSICKTSAQP